MNLSLCQNLRFRKVSALPQSNSTNGRSYEKSDDRRYHSTDNNSQVGKGGLPPLKIRSLSTMNLIVMDEWLRILSGGKPPFPTCEFARAACSAN